MKLKHITGLVVTVITVLLLHGLFIILKTHHYESLVKAFSVPCYN